MKHESRRIPTGLSSTSAHQRVSGAPPITPSAPAIRVNGLSKTYRIYKKEPGLIGAAKGLFHRRYESVAAAAGISFQVEAGEVVGFLGPNGAGKTTTLKMLAGLLYPTSGTASVLGFTPWERRVEYRRQFALLLGQKNQLWWDLPARDSLELNSRIYGVDRRDFERTLGELAEMLDVTDKLEVMVRELSLGERMKMEMIASLLHHPKILFLDEPTIGLDVVAQAKVREFLKEYNAQKGTTILLTSHYMADIEALCRRVIIVDHGCVIYDGPLSEVLDQAADAKLVSLRGVSPAQAASLDWRKLGEIVELTPQVICLRVQRDRVIRVCRELLSVVPVTDMNIEDLPIESVIKEIFSRQTAVHAARSRVNDECDTTCGMSPDCDALGLTPAHLET
jgi:ABC-2 type transport system ATP-binding protein